MSVPVPAPDTQHRVLMMLVAAHRCCYGAAVAKKGSWHDTEDKGSGPFAKLAALRDTVELPKVEVPAAPKGDVPLALRDTMPIPAYGLPEPAAKGPAKAVVRLERKGRGGKDVTVIEQLGLGRIELETWLKALKTRLGCGGDVEDDNLVLQGDLRSRLEPLLKARGVRKVIIG